LRPGLNLKKYGDWAIVTGATDGIGKALCFEFAKKGLNVVLISRTESKLKDVAAEIEGKYPKVHTIIVPIDFADFNETKQARVRQAVQDLKIAVLVNNVGMSYSYPQYYNELEDDVVRDLIELNISSTAFMTKIVLPIMESQSRGIVVNMSSGSSALGGCPLLAEYAASKAFVNEMSASLHYEYASSKTDIRVQAQQPLYVTSKLSKMKRASLTVPSPSTFARHSVKMMGYEPVISPYWAHALMLYLISLAPANVAMKFVKGQHLAIRKRALKKYGKAK